MSFLPQGRSLPGFLPDLDLLLEDPATYLRHRSVVIGPRRMYGLAALFALPGIVILASLAFHKGNPGERVALGVGLLLGSAIWAGWSLKLRGHSLVLTEEGVEVRYLDTTVWCPWALFNVAGEPFVPDSDSPRTGLILPVAAEAVPFVEFRRDETLVMQGAGVEGPQWKFTAGNEAVLPARYEVTAADIGQLLLKVGRRLGQEKPRGTPPAEALRMEGFDEVPTVPEPGGWITVPITRLRFPTRCCSCGSNTSVEAPVRVEARADAVLRGLSRSPLSAELMVPLCEECQEDLARRHQRGGSMGMALGGLAGLLAVLVIAYFQRDLVGVLFIAGLFALGVGGLLGYLIGSALGHRPPIQVRRYDPSRGTLTLRFRDPDYGHLVLDAMREEARQMQRRKPLG
jgi:hypothetical protein